MQRVEQTVSGCSSPWVLLFASTTSNVFAHVKDLHIIESATSMISSNQIWCLGYPKKRSGHAFDPEKKAPVLTVSHMKLPIYD